MHRGQDFSKAAMRSHTHMGQDFNEAPFALTHRGHVFNEALVRWRTGPMISMRPR